MVFIYLPFMASLLTALVLAARSGHPLEYRGAEGVVKGVCEAISLLYIFLWLLIIFLQWLVECSELLGVWARGVWGISKQHLGSQYCIQVLHQYST